MEARQGGDGLPAPFTTAPVPVREVAGQLVSLKRIQKTATTIRSVRSSEEIHSRVLKHKGHKKEPLYRRHNRSFYFPALTLAYSLLPSPPVHPATDQNQNTAQHRQIRQDGVDRAAKYFIGVMIPPEFQLVSDTPDKKRQT